MSREIIERLKNKISDKNLACIDEINYIKEDKKLIAEYCPSFFGLEDCKHCDKMCLDCWNTAINKISKENYITEEVLQYMLGYIFGYLHDKEETDKEVHNALRHEILDVYGIDIKDEFLL